MGIGIFAMDRRPVRWILAAALAAVTALVGLPAIAQTGQTLWTNNCAGCHVSPPEPANARVNAANAEALLGNIIVNGGTNGTGMNTATLLGLLQTDRIKIGTYLESVFHTNSTTASPTFQSSATVSLAGLVDLNTAATHLSQFETVLSPSRGSVSYSTATPSFTYTAGACQTGSDSFSYRVHNAGDTITTSTRTVSVVIGGDPPGINGDSNATAPTNTRFTYTPTLQAPAASCQRVVAWSVSGPSWLSINPRNGVVTGVPPDDAIGAAVSFTVTATYPGGGTATKTVAVTVTQGGPAPPLITSPSSASGAVNVPFSYQITANNSPTAFAATPLPKGLAVNTATGLISGTPQVEGVTTTTVSATGFTTASLDVVITIGSGSTGPPVATDQTVEVPPGVPTSITLAVTGQFTQITLVTPPATGTATPPAAGSAVVVYTPNAGFTGADSFTYKATGAAGTSNTARVNITVVSRPPVAKPAALTTQLNVATTVDLGPFITGSGITGIAVAAEASHGTTAVNGTKVTYTPRHDFFGSDSFSYVAFGSGGTSSPAVVAVSVTGRPDPSKDANVTGLLNAQSQVASRFARAQISNYQRRMETLHVDPPNSDVPPPATPRKVAERRGSGPDVVVGTPPYAPGFVRTRADAVDSGSAAASSTEIVPASFVTAMLSLAQSGTVSLANSTERGDANAGPLSGVGLWAGGNISFGTRGGSETVAGSRFTTDGITVGVDWRVNRELVVGMGVGYATDKTRFGDDGTKLKSDGTSVAGYASFQPSRNTFIDALLGYGTLNLDSDRFVSSVDQFAFANRDGHQIFGSVAAGFEYRNNWLLLSPYGRLDFTYDKFKQVTENGAGLNALTYLDQSQHAFQGSLGLRAESQHDTSYGLVRPRVRIEYRHDFEGAGNAGITYADQFAGLSYSVAPVGTKRNFLLLGAGSDFIFRGGLKLGVDYQWQSSGGADSGQAIRLLVSQELDGKGWPSVPWTARSLTDAVRVEGGFAYDDNVTRGRADDEILSDKIYSLNASTSRTFNVNENTRGVVTGILNGEAFHTYTGLEHVSGGLQAEVQYRGSADFNAITWAAFARGFLDAYNSHLRDGGRWAVGLSARSSVTDRIDLYGEVAANWRRANSDVWNLNEYVARLNLDYSLGRIGTFYLAGEYHRGDTVSDGKASLVNLSIAEVLVPDDAFPGKDLFAYRFDGRTWVGTVGLNFPLGQRDSIDFSYRRVTTTPVSRPSFETGSLRYFDNQYTVLYLVRF